jgi:hypothetical protein
MKNKSKIIQISFFTWGTFYGLTIPKYGIVYLICSFIIVLILAILYLYKDNDNAPKPIVPSNSDDQNQKSTKVVLFAIVSFTALITYLAIKFLKSI